MLPTKFQTNWFFGSGDEAKNRFSKWHHGGHLGFPTGTTFAIFNLQVIPMLHTEFRVYWLSVQEKKQQKKKKKKKKKKK